MTDLDDAHQPHRRTADEKLDILYDALIGTPTQKGRITVMEEKLDRLVDRFAEHESEQQERDERAEEGKKEVREVLFEVAKGVALALVGGIGGVWLAIQAFLSGGAHGK